MAAGKALADDYGLYAVLSAPDRRPHSAPARDYRAARRATRTFFPMAQGRSADLYHGHHQKNDLCRPDRHLRQSRLWPGVGAECAGVTAGHIRLLAADLLRFQRLY